MTVPMRQKEIIFCLFLGLEITIAYYFNFKTCTYIIALDKN